MGVLWLMNRGDPKYLLWLIITKWLMIDDPPSTENDLTIHSEGIGLPT